MLVSPTAQLLDAIFYWIFVARVSVFACVCLYVCVFTRTRAHMYAHRSVLSWAVFTWIRFFVCLFAGRLTEYGKDIPLRIFINNEAGYFVGIEMYREEEHPTSKHVRTGRRRPQTESGGQRRKRGEIGRKRTRGREGGGGGDGDTEGKECTELWPRCLQVNSDISTV